MKSIEFKEWEAHSDFSYCYGKLHLIVDGKEWVSEGLGCLKHSFGCWIDDEGEEHFKSGQWQLNEPFFKDFSKDEKKVIFKLVNENIEAHCCGGCL